MAEQLSPRAVLARRRIPDARAVGSMIPPGGYCGIGGVEEFVLRCALVPDARRQYSRTRRLPRNLQGAWAALDVSAFDVCIGSVANGVRAPVGHHIERPASAKEAVARSEPLADSARR